MAEVRGLAELKRALDQIPVKMQQNVCRAGNRAVANAVRNAVRESAQQGTVRAAVTAQPNPRSKKTKGFLVGLRKPFSAMSHWFEFGTGPRWQKTTGKYVGRMPATPWLRPALEKVGAQAEAIWAKAASRNFDRQMRKLGK